MQGEDQIPPKYREYAEALRALHPAMAYRVWDATALRHVCWSLGPRYGMAYDRCRHLHQRVDFGRYCIVLAYGGITIDMDVKPITSFDHVLASVPRETLGVSQFPLSSVESSILSWRPQSWWLNNATLMAHRPGLPACRFLVDRIADRLFASWWHWLPQSTAILYTTGPYAFVDVFRSMPRSMWTMVPSTYFEPCSGYDVACRPSTESVVNHVHDGTWQPGWYGSMMRGYYHLKRHPEMVVCLVVVVLIVWRRGWRFRSRP